jgi:3-isopropylmalate/(R)-2-methylmalate dehydratase small subunit
MESFNTHTGIVAPIDRANIDTDAIIPKQFLKSVKKSGFGPNLFDEWRYLDHGEPGMDNSIRELNPEFVLNQPRYQYSSVLLTRENFGCGSSREHAPWALSDFGFKVIIASSYADIFYNNCFKNGILPIVLEAQVIDTLFQAVEQQPGYKISVDLEKQQIHLADNSTIEFEIEAARKNSLLLGLDEIGETLQSGDKIHHYENNRKQTHPWLFNSLND